MLRIEAQWDPLLLLSEGTGSCLSGDGRRGKLQDLLERLGLCGDSDGSGWVLPPTTWNVVPSGGEKRCQTG